MREISFDRKSIRTRLIMAFVVTSFLPIALVNIVAYYNTSRLVRQNVESMTNANLEQISVSLDVWLDSYEDILYQVYTDDNIVELVDKINAGEDVASNRQMLRRALRGMVYTKDYVKFISVMTDSGELVFYNQLTSATTRTSWMDSISMSQAELYREISGDNKSHTIPTGDKVVFGSNSCYLFHIGRRIIDYRDVDKRCGIVLVSIDERLLEEICSTTENGLNFIVDSEGTLISCAGSERVGQTVYGSGASEADKRAAYQKIARETGILGETELSLYSVHDEERGWEIIRVTSQEELIHALRQQQQLRVFIIVLSLCTVTAVMLSQVTKMTDSIERVVGTMRKAGKGDLTIRVAADQTRPTEIEVIAEEFNSMMDKLKQSTRKQKNAEIAALEAQINPHFLYNTLDTINWMAIDRDEYEISNMIATLAGILRYGISDSNGVVKIRDEVDWLKQYIFLQQTKLKNSFDCHINVEPEIMGLPIHKLLLQPFIENAILHGFEGIDRAHKLQMDMGREGDRIIIRIQDNGCGMPAEMVREMNAGIFKKTDNRNHIGMENAITRIHMYYGESAEVKIESQAGQGTAVRILIPVVNAPFGEETGGEEQ
ncbi:MAG: sensor histidine kinase [Lachnospiraceae bacterium]|nr:sensor histidine kinase [Lachnospiraceae bacterium]